MQHFGEADYEIDKAIASHHGTPYIAKKCECWEGYKRVPGTKPCAPGSCEKCDTHSKSSGFLFPGINPSDHVTMDPAERAELESLVFQGSWQQIKDYIERIRNQFTGERNASAIKLADEANDRIDALWNQAVKIAKVQNPNIDESLKDEVIFSCLGKVNFNDITPEMMAEKILQKSNRPVMASQGDKPSPHAAQAVLAALEAGDEDAAKELLKKTDCPEGCETHPEGKCNHQYMSAGRTRVRYLINDSSFDKSEDLETPVDESVAIKE